MEQHREKSVPRHTSAKKVAFMGMLFALSMALSFLENMITIPGMPPGVKLGLSNIVTMYCIFFLGAPSAYTLAVLKALFVLSTRGVIASALSLSGGLLSISVMLLMIHIKKANFSYLILSIFGAVSHNIGQIIMARFIIGTALVYFQIPILLVSGVIFGIITSTVLRIILPYIKKLELLSR